VIAVANRPQQRLQHKPTPTPDNTAIISCATSALLIGCCCCCRRRRRVRAASALDDQLLHMFNEAALALDDDFIPARDHANPPERDTNQVLKPLLLLLPALELH
jgi:hypothetical protein